jgi:hypothetical protein
MPKVQAYGNRSVQANPLPGARLTNVASPDSYGAQLGETIGRIGINAFTADQQQARDQADQTAILKADTQLGAWSINRLHGENGALAQKGEAAFGLPEEVGQEFQDQAAEIEKGLTTDRQRMAFAKVKADRQLELQGQVQAHVTQQRQQFDLDQTKAAIDLAVSEGATNAGNPYYTSKAFQRGTDAVQQFAFRQGMSTEQAQQAQQDYATKFHTAVIGQFLAVHQDKYARAYFDETKDQINGQALPQLEKALDTSTTLGDAQRAADSIRTMGGTLSTRLDAVRAIDDPEVRQQTQSLVEHDFALEERAQTEGERQKMIDIGNLIDQKGIRAVSPAVWSTLTVDQKENFERYAKRNATGEKVENPVLFYSLVRQASEHPDDFGKLVLSDPKYLAKLSKTEWSHLVDVQASILKGDQKKTDTLLDGFRTADQIINDTLDTAGIPRQGSDVQHDAIARYRRMVDEQTQTLERLTGKKATKDDIQKIADDVMGRQITEPTGFWSALFGLSGSSKRLINATIADVPPLAKQQITDALRRSGAQVTDDAILRVFLHNQMRGGK